MSVCDRNARSAPLLFTASLGALVGAVLGCSTLAPEQPEVECSSDEDCDVGAGEVCAIDQGNVCLVATLPPRSILGLDVREASGLRVDVRGTDAAVERVTTRTPSRYRISIRNRGSEPFFPGVKDVLSLSFREISYYSSNAAMETVWETLYTKISLSQESRIGQTPHSISGDEYPIVPADAEEPDTELPYVVPWPHYTAADVDGDRPLVLELRPTESTPEDFGVIRRILRRDQIPEATEHTITVDTTRECVRDLSGEITILHKAGEPLENLDAIPLAVSLRYGAGVTSPATIQPPPAKIACATDQNCPQPNRCVDPEEGSKFCGCEGDADCPSGQICYAPQNRCTLDLEGSDAYRRADLMTTDGTADVLATVYTHCEGEVEEAREVPMTASLEPLAAENGLPRLTFDLTPSFTAADPGGDSPPTPLGGKLCLPHWRPASAVSVTLAGSPANLYSNELGSFTCCGTECLSDVTPSSKPSACTPQATLTPSGVFSLPEPAMEGEPTQWENAGCLPLYVPGEESPTETRFTRNGVACTPESCELLLSPGPYDLVDPFPYDLRIEPPVGSIFRSVAIGTEIAADTAELPTITLPYRVLLRGEVTLGDGICKPSEDGTETECAVSAQVMVERIRLADETDALGPFFYSASTFSGGDFVVPVNPGVYLVTALPQVGSQGGPAAIKIVDLRDESDLVDVRNGVPYADLADPLVLQQGQLVTVELDAFSSNTTVIPLDMASWSGLTFGGMAIDLSAASTCYRASSNEPPACQIRRLRPGSTTLRPSQEEFVKFITRN